jgi:hypothetical protein
MTAVSGLMNDVDKPGSNGETGIRLTEQQLRARRARSLAIALALGAFVILIFVVTLVRLGSNVQTPHM